MYRKYLKYVLRHKWYVFIECCKLGIPLRGLLHDLSKLLPSEFFPYARYFYGRWIKERETEVNNAFDLAWLKHQKRNPHHWQYWLLEEDSGSMKALGRHRKYTKEMVADWIGAGKAIHGKNDVRQWYEENKYIIVLDDVTRLYVECLIRESEE